MPIEYRPATKPFKDEKLIKRLVAELTRPTKSGPHIIQEKLRGLPRHHVTVIWDSWSGIDPVDRSDMILEAYQRALGAEGMLEISMALGLTQVEAKRLGMAA